MADMKDILGVRGAPPPEKKEKEKKEKIERPKGMSREAFKLLDGSHPIMPSQLIPKEKDKGKEKKRPSARKVEWRWAPYKNSGRTDGFQLSRWQRAVKDPQGKFISGGTQEDYWFARYNKRVPILKYNDEEYRSVVHDPRDPSWSKEETDYLLGLCEQFDLRFPVIHDRYSFPKGPLRSIEDLKARYYHVARRLMVAREGCAELVGHEVIHKTPFDPVAETERKRAMDLLFRLAPDQAAEQEKILAAARRIEERRAAEAAASTKAAEKAQEGNGPLRGSDLLPPLPVPSNGPTFYDQELRQIRLPPGAYSRGVFVREEMSKQRSLYVGLSNKSSSNAAKLAKAIEQQIEAMGCSPHGPRMPTKRTCLAYLALQKELIEAMENRRKAAERSRAAAPPPPTQPTTYIPMASATPLGSQLDLGALTPGKGGGGGGGLGQMPKKETPRGGQTARKK